MVLPMMAAAAGTHERHRSKLHHHRVDGVGSYKFLAHAAHDDGNHRVADGPDHIIEDNGGCRPDKGPEHHPVKPAQVVEAELDLMLPPEQEPGHNEEFHHTGDGSSQRGALDLQTGRAKVAEDEYPVEEDIHHKRGGVDHQ